LPIISCSAIIGTGKFFPFPDRVQVSDYQFIFDINCDVIGQYNRNSRTQNFFFLTKKIIKLIGYIFVNYLHPDVVSLDWQRLVKWNGISTILSHFPALTYLIESLWCQASN